MNRIVCVVALVGLAGLAACQSEGHRGPVRGGVSGEGSERGQSLYERLGGEVAIRAVVDDLTQRASQNAMVNFAREGMPTQWAATPDNVDHFKRAMTAFLVEKTGGPADYEGMDMKAGHRGMRISHAEFNALLADADASLRALDVADPERKEVLKLLDSYRRDIVEVP